MHKQRREPTQQRSRERVARILRATAELLGENGFHGLTTKAIAAKAEVPIGTFYQFFNNKETIIQELVLNYKARVRQFLQNNLSTEEIKRTGMNEAVVTVVIEGLGGINSDMPGFASIWSESSDEGPIAEAAASLRNEVFISLDTLLAQSYPKVSNDDRQRCLTMVVQTIRRLLVTSQGSDNFGPEIKRMIGLYMASYFGPEQGP